MLRPIATDVFLIIACALVVGCASSAQGNADIPEIERLASLAKSVRTEVSAGDGSIVTYYASSQDVVQLSNEIQSHLQHLGHTDYRKVSLQSGGVLFAKEVKPEPGYPMTIAVEPGEQGIESGAGESRSRSGATVIFTY